MRKPILGDDRGGVAVFVLGILLIFFILIVTEAFSYVSYVYRAANDLHNGIGIAGRNALSDFTTVNPADGSVIVTDNNLLEQHFSQYLSNQLQKWPSSCYTITSFQVYSETDRNSQAPVGFSTIVPGTSIYVKMDLILAVMPGLVPETFSHWSIPLTDIISQNSYESATGEWNLVR